MTPRPSLDNDADEGDPLLAPYLGDPCSRRSSYPENNVLASVRGGLKRPCVWYHKPT